MITEGEKLIVSDSYEILEAIPVHDYRSCSDISADIDEEMEGTLAVSVVNAGHSPRDWMQYPDDTFRAERTDASSADPTYPEIVFAASMGIFRINAAASFCMRRYFSTIPLAFFKTFFSVRVP